MSIEETMKIALRAIAEFPSPETDNMPACSPSGAWVQNFGGGYQGGAHKDDTYRARAVRRVLIKEPSHD